MKTQRVYPQWINHEDPNNNETFSSWLMTFIHFDTFSTTTTLQLSPRKSNRVDPDDNESLSFIWQNSTRFDDSLTVQIFPSNTTSIFTHSWSIVTTTSIMTRPSYSDRLNFDSFLRTPHSQDHSTLSTTDHDDAATTMNQSWRFHLYPQRVGHDDRFSHYPQRVDLRWRPFDPIRDEPIITTSTSLIFPQRINRFDFDFYS